MRRLIRRAGRSATVISSAALGLAMLGDALLYAVLPLYAGTFGISLVWVGVLLSVNRLVRLFVYGWVSHLAGVWGLRPLTVAAVAVGACSTLAFAVGSGEAVLLAARVAWGLAFAAMSVAVLAYATHQPDGAAGRVGWSFSIRQGGPLLALTVGAWLASAAGPRTALLVLGGISLVGVLLALRLPDVPMTRPSSASRWWPGMPGRVDLTKFGVALTADGLFVATIGLVLHMRMGAEAAVLGAGLVLAGKQLGAVILSPVGGVIGDRLGAAPTAVGAIVVLTAGLGLLAVDWLAAGIALVLVARPLLLAVLPVLAVELSSKTHLSALASLNTWRDLGAGVGPLVALPALQWIGAPWLFGTAALLLLMLALPIVPRARTRHTALEGARVSE